MELRGKDTRRTRPTLGYDADRVAELKQKIFGKDQRSVREGDFVAESKNDVRHLVKDRQPIGQAGRQAQQRAMTQVVVPAKPNISPYSRKPTRGNY